jgi:hypothetical protein
MNWKEEVKEKYEDIVLRIPEAVRPVIKPELLKKAEQKCTERKGASVAEVDLITALFEVTPPAFQNQMTKDLEELGIDFDRYLAKVKGDFEHDNDLDQLVKDMGVLCEIVGIEHKEQKIREVLDAYKPFFKGSPLSIRTTTKPVAKRDVSARYVELMMPHEVDPYIIALNKGFIEKNGHPIHDLNQEIPKVFQIMGYGVDLDARVGLAKIWPFIVPDSIDPLFSMKYFPESINTYKSYFKDHNLNIFSLFALDFLHNTTNIYFMLKDPSKNSIESCIGLVEDLGFESAPIDVMEKCSEAAHLNYTFSWDSDRIERLCFGITCESAEEVPIHLHPLMKEYVERSPFQSKVKKFIYGVTFKPDGLYYKIETDYNGTMADFLLMGAKAGIESYN